MNPSTNRIRWLEELKRHCCGINLEHVAYRELGKYLVPLQLLKEGP